MKDSTESRQEQKTPKGGCPEEVRKETEVTSGAHQADAASKNGNDDAQMVCTSNLLEWILERENMKQAYEKVVSNKGSHGIDKMTVDQLKPYLAIHWEEIKSQLLDGTYKPLAVRRVEIPKPDGGGTRLLGIPTLLDRLIQQSIAQILNGVFDHTFSNSSYGFRKGRSAHDAILAAQGYISEGYGWVVDTDLEKFFDRVNHDKLMSLVARRVSDKKVLKLIRRYLESGAMINGLEFITEDGVPQGGPLSPLLSNIMLDEFDKELEKRGHRFVRYADDCNIYVKSKRAGERVFKSIKAYLETELKLKINEAKSTMDRPEKLKFLGFSFYRRKGEPRIRIHSRSYQRLKVKVKRVTNRNWGVSMEYRLKKLAEITNGWVNYFGKVADGESRLNELDGWIRRRLRACIWKQWKKVKTRYRNLMKLGASKEKAWEYANTRKSYWRTSNSPILSTTVTNQRLEKRGFKSLVKRYHVVHLF